MSPAQAEVQRDAGGGGVAVPAPMSPSPADIIPDDRVSAPPSGSVGVRVLVVEDDPGMRTFLSECFRRHSYHVEATSSGEQAVEAFFGRTFDVIVTDYRLPEMNGLDLTRAVKAVDPETVVIMITAFADLKVADRAIQEGVTDYILKPFNANQLFFVIERSLRYRRLAREHGDMKKLLDSTTSFGGLVGVSVVMKELYQLIERVASSEATVLILGESGTGKELIAREIHTRSRRKDGSFCALNCAAVPETLLESELFGYEQGAFTGADRRKPGLLERARGGTLFLDEIAEMTPAMQAKLLRVLQEKEITRLGGGEVVKVDIRLVAATNRDLNVEVEKGTFRKDLFYRLNVVPIKVPPLRARREDIPILASHFLRLYAERNRKEINEISIEAMVLLCHYAWPGNIRELENTIERVVTLTSKRVVSPEDLSDEVRGAGAGKSGGPLPPDPSADLSLKEAKQWFEKRYMERLLRRVKGNVSEAARTAQVDRPYFYKKIKKYGIDPDSFRENGAGPEGEGNHHPSAS